MAYVELIFRTAEWH